MMFGRDSRPDMGEVPPMHIQDSLTDEYVLNPDYVEFSDRAYAAFDAGRRRGRMAMYAGALAAAGGLVFGFMSMPDGSHDVSADPLPASPPAATATPFHYNYPTVYEDGQIPNDPTTGHPIIDLAVARHEFPDSPPPAIQQAMKSVVSVTASTDRLDPLGSPVLVNGKLKLEGGAGTGFVVNVPALGGDVIMSAGHVNPKGYQYYNGIDKAYTDTDGYPEGYQFTPDAVYTRYNDSVDESTNNGEPDISIITTEGDMDTSPAAIPAIPILGKSLPFGALVVNPNLQPTSDNPTGDLRGPGAATANAATPYVIEGIDLGAIDPNKPDDDVIITIGSETDKTDTFQANVGGSSGSFFAPADTDAAFGVTSQATFNRETNTPTTVSSAYVEQLYGVKIVDDGQPTDVHLTFVDRIASDPTTQTGTTPNYFNNMDFTSVEPVKPNS